MNQYFISENITNPDLLSQLKLFSKYQGVIEKIIYSKMSNTKNSFIAKRIKEKYDKYKKFCSKDFLTILEMRKIILKICQNKTK